MRRLIEYSWRRRWALWLPPFPLLLLPAGVFAGLVALRRGLYRHRLLPRTRLPAPVIVVGNIGVGGNGKTPFTVWLVELLRAHGYRPAVLSRGYGAGKGPRPLRVDASLSAADCGDEPLLIAQSTGAPVYVDARRVRAGRRALADGADVLVCDDGLQHYRLQRDLEIVLVDGQRRFGNGLPLPAGPLREPRRRLAQADFVVIKGEGAPGETCMRFVNFRLRRITNGALFEPATFAGQRVHAVAGIAAPGGFFDQLRGLGLKVIEHPLPDHAEAGPERLDFGDDLAVVMTGKDAVKCRPYAHARCFALDFDVQLDDAFAARLLEKLGRGQKTARHPGLPAVQGTAGS
ncbi:tetraacyldisaccharide 4'-kinase [Immundisolibacter sp.]|uniref:tetraacyldisaccharide 4'-kinase n=1 Tax=Immundisolibacter sp. TaxID=1934948 RepID=UPI003F86DAD2